MNVTAHQERKKNEETKKGKRGAGEKKKRKQATDFEEAVLLRSFRGQNSEKVNGSAQGIGRQPAAPEPHVALLLFFEASKCEMILRSMTLTTGEDLFFFFFLENTYDLCSVELFWLLSVSLLW